MMITDQMIKRQFITDTFMRDAEAIASTEVQRLTANYHGEKSKAMATQLMSHPYTVDNSGNNPTLSFTLLTALRFLDIHISRTNESKEDELYLYNRVVWGTLYRRTLGDLKYGLTEDVRKSITAQLESMNPQNL